MSVQNVMENVHKIFMFFEILFCELTVIRLYGIGSSPNFFPVISSVADFFLQS